MNTLNILHIPINKDVSHMTVAVQFWNDIKINS